MKKKNLKGLKLNKKEISNLTETTISGGFTGGCTDGCTPFQSATNCTKQNCTDDCDNGSFTCYCFRD